MIQRHSSIRYGYRLRATNAGAKGCYVHHGLSNARRCARRRVGGDQRDRSSLPRLSSIRTATHRPDQDPTLHAGEGRAPRDGTRRWFAGRAADEHMFGCGANWDIVGCTGAPLGPSPWVRADFRFTVLYDLPSTRSLKICRAAAMSFELLSSLKSQRPSR